MFHLFKILLFAVVGISSLFMLMNILKKVLLIYPLTFYECSWFANEEFTAVF